MNEQIKALLLNARNMFVNGVTESDNKIYIHGSEENLEKFAQLIVRECAEQIIAKGTDWVDFAPSQTGVRLEYWDMAQQIKEHFGVEE